jgi:hypothetical protein
MVVPPAEVPVAASDPARDDIAVTPVGSAARRRALRWALRFVELGPVVILAVLVIVMGILSPFFFRSNNLTNLGFQTAVIAALAIGQVMVILTRGIDLSVGATVAFTGVLAAVVQVRPQRRERLVDLRGLARLVDLVRAQVVVAVMADLVPGVGDRADGVGMAQRGRARHVERGAHPVLAEQVEDPRHPARDAELALGERAEPVAMGVEAIAEAGLGVDVEGQADGRHAGILSSNP